MIARHDKEVITMSDAANEVRDPAEEKRTGRPAEEPSETVTEKETVTETPAPQPTETERTTETVKETPAA